MSANFPIADFTPQLVGYTGQAKFRFWCQKVLPIVYDDSLSYYELLNKVVAYLNNVINDVANVETNVAEMYDVYTKLLEWIDNYYENLDIQEEVDDKLDRMADDGTLTRLIAAFLGADLHWEFNDTGYAELEKVVDLQIPENMGLQGGTYFNGYFYGVCPTRGGGPMHLVCFSLVTGEVISQCIVNDTGHGNGASVGPDNKIYVFDSATNTIYTIDPYSMVAESLYTFGGAAISSGAFSENGEVLAIQSSGQITMAIYGKLGYPVEGFRHGYYPVSYIGGEAKGVGLVQDICFCLNVYICSLVTNAADTEAKRKNMFRVTGINGIRNRDIYFDNSIVEPEAISYNPTDDRIYIAARNGSLYRTVLETDGLFKSSYFGKAISSIKVVALSAANSIYKERKTGTSANEGVSISIDTKFPMPKPQAVTGASSGDIVQRLKPEYVMYSSFYPTVMYRSVGAGWYATGFFKGVTFRFYYPLSGNTHAYLRNIIVTLPDGTTSGSFNYSGQDYEAWLTAVCEWIEARYPGLGEVTFSIEGTSPLFFNSTFIGIPEITQP